MQTMQTGSFTRPAFLSLETPRLTTSTFTATMNPMNGPGGPPVLWQEAHNAEGRAYYYNVQTKATQWMKPVELMTPVEVSVQVVVCPKKHLLIFRLL